MPSYFHPHLEVRDCRIGKGIFAASPIRQGEVVIDFWNGPGIRVGTKEAYRYEAAGSHYIIQIDEDLYNVAVRGPELGDFINHSCHPNCGVKGKLAFVAMRDIASGEEVTFDYSMTESYFWYKMPCDCRTDRCRGAVTGSDWKRKDLQMLYKGYFSDYIEKKISRPWIIKVAYEWRERIGLGIGSIPHRIRYQKNRFIGKKP
jgi:uncharacterized protein